VGLCGPDILAGPAILEAIATSPSTMVWTKQLSNSIGWTGRPVDAMPAFSKTNRSPRVVILVAP